jgi:hypothetical protein
LGRTRRNGGQMVRLNDLLGEGLQRAPFSERGPDLVLD